MRPTDRDDPRVVQWAAARVADAKYRAKKSGVPFNLTTKYVQKIWTGICPVFGFIFRFRRKCNHQSPSLDRLLPELGYTQGNVAIISMKANQIKQDATWMELWKVSRWIRNVMTKGDLHASLFIWLVFFRVKMWLEERGIHAGIGGL